MRVLPLNCQKTYYLVDNHTNKSHSQGKDLNFRKNQKISHVIQRNMRNPLVEGITWETLGLGAFFTGLGSFIFDNSWDMLVKSGLTGVGALAAVTGMLIKNHKVREIEKRTVIIP